ncbi:hypothetical protein GCM10020254_21550 [Streptomyces goshikiensis]
MADGTSQPIEELEPGDRVLATDPESGETVTKEVTATIQGEGVKNLVEITVDTDADAGTSPELITATDKHPFWVPALNKWVAATDLQPGEWLQTSAGTHVQITALKRWTSLGTTVHNLTVEGLHTYYVLAGSTPVLVHNCGGSFTIPNKKWANNYGGDIGKQGIEATYDYGILEMVVRAPKNVDGLPSGSQMISHAISAFEGAGLPVDGIRGAWVAHGGLADNLQSLNAAVQSGSTVQQGVWRTATGKFAARNGFTDAVIDTDSLRGNPGNYEEFVVNFMRPGV